MGRTIPMCQATHSVPVIYGTYSLTTFVFTVQFIFIQTMWYSKVYMHLHLYIMSTKQYSVNYIQ